MNRDLLVLKGAISEMPAEEREKILALAERIRSIIKANGVVGTIAACLVAGEIAAAEEKQS